MNIFVANLRIFAKKCFHDISKWRRYVTRHLCSKNKDFSPCLPGQALDFSIFSIHKYKIFLLITFFKIFANDWAHMGNKYTNVAIKCQCAQSFLNILKKVINKKILYLCIEIMLKSSFYSVAFNFFGPSLPLTPSSFVCPRENFELQVINWKKLF